MGITMSGSLNPAGPAVIPSRAATSQLSRLRHTSEAARFTVRKGRIMLRALRIGLLALVAGGIASSSVRASEDKATPKTYAVIVGVSDYADAQIKPRPTAEPDAKALFDVVIDPNHVGAAKGDVKLFLGK